MTFKPYDFSEHYRSRVIAKNMFMKLRGNLAYSDPDQLSLNEMSDSETKFPGKSLDTDGFIICVDISKDLEDQNNPEKKFFESLLSCVLPKKKPVVVVCTKFDKARENSIRVVKKIVASTRKPIQIIEVSALQGVNTDVCFLYFAKPRIKVKPYTEAILDRNSEIKRCKECFEHFLHRIMEVTMSTEEVFNIQCDEIQQIKGICGSKYVKQTIQDRLRRIRQMCAQEKENDFLERLPMILKEVLPKLDSDATTVTCKEALHHSEKFAAYFTELENWKEDIDFLKSRKSSHIPFEFLGDHQAEELLQKHINQVHIY